jgi:hypothetical protein
MYGQLGLVVFGVLAVTSDQADGMLRICLTAIPRRGRCYAGKLLDCDEDLDDTDMPPTAADAARRVGTRRRRERERGEPG